MAEVKKKISEKHKAFCRALIKNKFNQTKAYKEVYPDVKMTSAKVEGSRLLTNVNIQDYLSKLSNKNEEKELVTVEEIIDGIKETVLQARKENQLSAAMKGFELLGKSKAVFAEKRINEHEFPNANISISISGLKPKSK